MNDIPTWAQQIITIHKNVANKAVSHAGRLKSDRYFVWCEDGIDQDGYSDNEHMETAVSGATDLFTKKEFDPWARDIEKEYTKAGIIWYKRGLDYEEDTGFWHYRWDWVIFD